MVIPASVRRALEEHARDEAPNEACGLVLLRDGRAVRYERGQNAARSPYRFELEMPDAEVWFLEDQGYELAVFHSHPSTSARPSRTDVERIGLWQDRPCLILSLATGELAAFRISDGRVHPEPVES